MKRKMLKKSVFALTAALSMVVSSLYTGGMTAAAEGTETVYIDENFDDYATGEVIRSAGNDVETAPDPKDMGDLIFAAGRRGNGGLTCVASIVGEDGADKYLDINEDGFATSSRGISFTFDYTAPTIAELQADGNILELSMDIATTGAVTITGFGDIPAGTDGLVQMIFDPNAGKKHVIVSDDEGALISSTTTDIGTATGFTGATFYVANTKAQIDDVKLVEKPVDYRTTTITVKVGDDALADATVTIGKCNLTTDANGQVSLTLPDGEYSVSAAKAGYEFTAGAADAATGTVTVDSNAAELTLTLLQQKYVSYPTIVTVGGGQSYVEAPIGDEPAKTAAFTTIVKDQQDVTLKAEEYAVEWSIVNAATGEADAAVTIDANGVVSVAKDLEIDGLSNIYKVVAKATANEKSETGEFTFYVVKDGTAYVNTLASASEVIPLVAQSKNMDQYSGTGYMGLSYKTEESGNGYMVADGSGKGGRGSRLDLASGIIKGASVTFDWLPVSADANANGNVMFLSEGEWHPYFGVRFGSDFKVYYYTENPLGACATVQDPFEGSTAGQDTGLSGQVWYSVSVDFDYLAHTADFTISQRDDASVSYTANDIPIEDEANSLYSMVCYMVKLAGDSVYASFGIDNIMVSYDVFGSEDLVSVTNPANVIVNKTEIAEYEFPATVLGETGDGTQVEVKVGEWTATPAFDENVSAEYVWTAQIDPGEYTNHFNLSDVTYTMTYTLLPYPTYVFNPPTLELKLGEVDTVDVASFPTTVIGQFSDGSTGTVNVGEWTAIREFNAEEEGIYVYGANIVAGEGYEVNESKLSPNENPADPAAQRVDYVYDVYYRISLFETQDNYNAYTRSMEYLDRGVYAVENEDGVFVSWRLLVTEYGEDIAFNVYRNGVQVNDEPIDSKTNFVDVNGKAGDIYVVDKIQDGLYYPSEEVVATAENYLTIPVQKPVGLRDKDGNVCTYTMNDASTGDVDGDGQYEIIIKWLPNDAFDSGQAGGPSGPTIIDVYKMDGTALWRLNLGLEMPSGAHFNQFAVYDLDQDGKAELFVKTSDGSTTYKPNAQGKFDMNDPTTEISYIGDFDVVPGSNVTSNGHVANTTNEYVTVFNGMTGEEISTIDYINVTGNFADWGKDDGGNRSARYNITVGYLPADQNDPNCTETIPAVLFNRGYYGKTTVAAYTLRSGQLNLEWNFSIESSDINAAKGNHNLQAGDVDKDGFDELVLGAIAIDHDGTILWAKNGLEGQDNAGHSDAIHLAAMNPENNDLYVFTPQEHTDATYNESLSNAGTGARYIANWFTTKDVGRGVAANITPNPGYEFWSASTGSGIYGWDGSIISLTKNVPMNWVLYWDGDLLSELGDGQSTEGNTVISKYNWETEVSDVIEVFDGTKMCNWTKNSPSLTADLFGDWREEVVVRNSDDTELRIYMTTIETDYMIYTLMHDPVYRNSVVAQNSAYNQPSHVGFYLGEDNKETVLNQELITANVEYTVATNEEGSETPSGQPEERGIIVGNEDCSSDWWTAHSDTWKVEEGETLVVELENHSSMVENWHNFVVVLQNIADAHAEVDGNGYKEYAVVRPDNYGWGTGYATAVLESNWNWDTFKSDMDGAKVVLNITNNGTTVDVLMNITTAAGAEHFQNFKGITIDGDLYICLAVEKAWVEIFNVETIKPDVPATPEEMVAAFVDRMYTVALGRDAEEEGATWWTNALLAGGSDGAGLAQGFLTGDEFKNKAYDNAQFVSVLYDTFFNRPVAEGEGDFWVNALNAGETRESVLSGFVNSTEFFNLCAEYGISRGTMKADGIAINSGIGQFAERLYTEVLERDGEESGMEYWAASISNGDCAPKDAAMNFFTSDEYVAKNTSNEEYLEALYRTFMGRASDEGGMNFWLTSMNNGTDDRTSALNSFAASAEFQQIMASYGLQ